MLVEATVLFQFLERDAGCPCCSRDLDQNERATTLLRRKIITQLLFLLYVLFVNALFSSFFIFDGGMHLYERKLPCQIFE